MNEMTAAVREENSADLFRRIFWDEQLKALQTKANSLASFSNKMVLTPKSTSAYHALRSTGVLTLPSDRTLFDYSDWISCEIGFQTKMNHQLLKEVD